MDFTKSYGNGRDVGEVGCDAWGVDHIVEGQLVDDGTRFTEQGQRLSCELSELILASHTDIFTWPMPPDAPRTAANKG